GNVAAHRGGQADGRRPRLSDAAGGWGAAAGRRRAGRHGSRGLVVPGGHVLERPVDAGPGGADGVPGTGDAGGLQRLRIPWEVPPVQRQPPAERSQEFDGVPPGPGGVGGADRVGGAASVVVLNRLRFRAQTLPSSSTNNRCTSSVFAIPLVSRITAPLMAS